MKRTSAVLPAGGDAFDAHCMEDGHTVAYLGCETREQAERVACAYVERGIAAAQEEKWSRAGKRAG